jgi:hypothetical protein
MVEHGTWFDNYAGGTTPLAPHRKGICRMPAVVAASPAVSNPSLPLRPSDLQRIEQALLDALLDVRPDNENAVDELLNDPRFAGDRAEVERFLAAAVMDTQSDRNRALDQMLGEAGPSAPPFAAHA